MNDQAWEQLVDLIDQKYGITGHQKFTEPIAGKQKLERLQDEVIFTKAGSDYKVTRISSPAVTQTKTRYAHRGTAQRVEHEYDPVELVHRVVFFKKAQSGAWQEIAPESLA